MVEPNQFYALSWDEFDADCKALAQKLAAIHPWHSMVAITRGGLVPAGFVANLLDIRRIDTLSLQTRADDHSQTDPSWLKPVAKDWDDAGLLIIDDLVDTGLTARLVREIFPSAHFASPYAKPAGRPFADTIVREFAQDVWIQFPWEKE
ncbi:MAG: xanthine phosphoribosyltransferase [Alphaproteobacteria bacterium]|nr:xanthine phosphoribosyltransferase [Alphaproteobacteria bacterium]